METEGLRVRELFKRTYFQLLKKYACEEIVLPRKTLAEIANDSD